MVVNCATRVELAKRSDDELVALANSGNGCALDVLLRRHAATHFRLAMSILKNEADAEDAVQNASLSIFRKFDTFKEDGAFAAWSHRVVVNAALMELRKRRRSRETEFDPASVAATLEAPGGTSPHRDLLNKEVREAVSAALELLEPKYRRAIELREIEGRSMAEMSEELDLTVGGVKTRLHRARATLRVWLEGEFDISLDHAA